MRPDQRQYLPKARRDQQEWYYRGLKTGIIGAGGACFWVAFALYALCGVLW